MDIEKKLLVFSLKGFRLRQSDLRIKPLYWFESEEFEECDTEDLDLFGATKSRCIKTTVKGLDKYLEVRRN